MAVADTYGMFWDSNNGDRTYNAESFENWLKKFFTSGVFANELQVTPSSGMTVNVSGGYANANGKVRIFADTDITLNAPNSTYPRIDTIVVRRNNTARTITLEKVTGAYSGNSPVPTAPSRTADVYELVLAEIRVNAGATEIIASNITDKREDTSVCGYVTGTVEEIDVGQITSQMQADFLAWFDEMKGQLSTDAAGHLQNEIDDLSDTVSTHEASIEAITERLTWKLAGTITGTSDTVSIPATASEIYVRLSYINASGADQLRFTWTIPADDLTVTFRNYNSGYNGGTSVTAFAQVTLSSTSAKINNLIVSGTNYATNAQLSVRYR